MQVTKIPYRVPVSEQHRDMLKEMATKNRRTFQGELELIIEQAHKAFKK